MGDVGISQCDVSIAKSQRDFPLSDKVLYLSKGHLTQV